nr:hypothetical protein [Trinickia acidisoli]
MINATPITGRWAIQTTAIVTRVSGIVSISVGRKTPASTISSRNGNILELLNTQTALANAQERRIQALTDWHNAKIQLASKLGRLEMGQIGSD